MVDKSKVDVAGIKALGASGVLEVGTTPSYLVQNQIKLNMNAQQLECEITKPKSTEVPNVM